ncbi:MAG: hypothetical protein Q7S34_01800 [bacterium]|nr:hypothetical protein [bacterium]
MRQKISTTLSILAICFCSAILLLIVYFSAKETENLNEKITESYTKLPVLSNSFLDTLKWRATTTSAPWEARDSAEYYEFNGKLYLFGGLNGNGTLVDGQPDYDKAKYFNDLWESDDGTNWKLITSHTELPPLRSMSIVPFNGKLFLYAGWSPTIGLNKDIWQSTDGIRWSKTGKEIPFPLREGQRILPANGKLYLFGGVDYSFHKTYNDVWESLDGLSWQVLTLNASWAPRWDHDVAFFKNKFWLIDGMTTGSDGFNDIWSSADGKDWTLEATGTPLGSRQGHVLLNYKGLLWLIGGLDAKSNVGVGDTWYSRNGRNWRKVPVNGDWLGREDHQAFVFKNKLWVLTGMDTNWHWTNDIWQGDFAGQ